MMTTMATWMWSAAANSNRVTWWQNGNNWATIPITTSFSGAINAIPADLDGDGNLDSDDNLDILAAGVSVNAIAWWENLTGNGSTLMEHVVNNGFLEAVSVFAADIDGDGDTDVMAAGAVEIAIRWWENQGGQFGLLTADTSPATIPGGGQDDLLQVAAVHNGRSGDNDLELTSLAFSDNVSASLVISGTIGGKVYLPVVMAP